MSKKLIRNLAAISLETLILGIIILILGISISGDGGIVGFLGGVGYLSGVLLLVACGITGCITYFGALVKIARMRRMGWFVGVLLFGVTAALIYGLVGPETKVSNAAMPLFLHRSYQKTTKTMGF